MKSKFEIGQKVKAVGFTNCFGNPVPEVNGLIVDEIRLVKPFVANDPMKPYYRIKASVGSLGYVEGAERFFEAV